MSYKLEPIILKGNISPEFDNEDQIFEIESFFWLLTSALGAEVSVDSIDNEFMLKNRNFFAIVQRMGLSLGRHIYGADFSGHIKNPIRVKVSITEDYMPLLAVLAASSKCILSVTIDDPKLYSYCTTVRDMIFSLGADATILSNSLYINGNGSLLGGIVNTKGDWRIILACVLASIVSAEEIIISHQESLQKTYPFFFDKLRAHSRPRLDKPEKSGRRE